MTPTIKPTIKQEKAWNKLLDPTTRYIVFGGGAGGGKSWLGCEWLLTNCYRYPGSKWFIGREELKRLMTSSYVTWNKVCKNHGMPQEDWKLNGQYNYIEFFNGSRIDLLDLKYLPSDPLYERFGSLEYTGGWIEEGGETHFSSFDVLKSRIGRHMNKEFSLLSKMFITCNPNKGWLYREVYRPFKDNLLSEDYAFIQSLYSDNPYTAEEYGKNLNQIKNRNTKERLMLGNWEYDDDPAKLIEYDAIVDLFTNTVESSIDKYLTADIARYGQDKTVIKLWEGFKVYEICYWVKQDLEFTKLKIAELLQRHKIPRSHAVVDEDGVGGGVVDGLPGVKGFVNNSSAIELLGEKENYRNLKSQCAFKAADKINRYEMAIETEDEDIKTMIIEELEQLKSKDIDKEQKLQIISKEEMKESLGRSPDFLDNIIMRMYFELDKPLAEIKTIIKTSYENIRDVL